MPSYIWCAMKAVILNAASAEDATSVRIKWTPADRAELNTTAEELDGGRLTWLLLNFPAPRSRRSSSGSKQLARGTA